MLGPYSSPMTKAILPVTEKYKTPVVQAEAASRSLFTQGYKYHFGIVATSEKYLTPVVEMAAEFAKKHGKKPSDIKVAMIFQDDSFSLDVRQGVVDEIKKFGMNTVIDDRMPKDLNDLTTFFTKVKALKPDVLLISGHEKGAATAARQMGEHKIEVPLIGMTHCESAKVVNDFPKVAEGFVCPTQWDETMKSSDPLLGTSAEYNKAMMAAHPDYKVVPYQTAERKLPPSLVWKDAFERAQSLDQEKVREALTKTDLETFCGHVKFADDGSNPGKDMVMRQIQGSQYKVVWPPKVAAAIGDLSARRALLSDRTEAGACRPLAVRPGEASFDRDAAVALALFVMHDRRGSARNGSDHRQHLRAGYRRRSSISAC